MAALVPAMVGACVLLGAGAAAALLFRWARIPGSAPAAAIAGGILAGVLLGPSVAWQAAPQWSLHYLQGGVEAQQAITAHRRQMQREAAALQAAGAAEDAVDARLAELQSQHDVLLRRLDSARRGALDARIWLLLVILSIVLALVGWSRARRSGLARLMRPPGAGAAPDGAAAEAAGPPRMSLPGAAMAIIPALLAAAILRWGAAGPGASLTAPAALAVGGAFGAGAILGPLQIRGRRVGAAADRLGMVCLVVSAVIIVAPALREPGARPWALLLPMGALLLGWVAGWIALPSRRIRALAREGLLIIAVPGAVALAAGQVDLGALTAGWRPTLSLLALALLAGAGQTVGAWLGMLAIGWRARPMRIALEALCGGLGVAQAVGGLLLLAVGALEPWTPAASVALSALLLSGLVVELTAPATLRMWRGLELASEEARARE